MTLWPSGEGTGLQNQRAEAPHGFESHRRLFNMITIDKIKSRLLRESDSDLIDQMVDLYGDELKFCTGIICMTTCEWVAVFVVGSKRVLKVGVKCG